ncbi:TIGR01212 family radical SAM protein [Faecalibacillus intestinalis]|uniref:TIGR01212 family radical SAM protein n=1 Tax=Faecalibacillus intestinalis TaxID=1982626 RepID=UPI0022E6B35C|nr:TIGR01212 family radical SAM protein [Faecalibacillus intestinalis]
MNQFKYSLDNKRYHTYNYYLKNKYHQKVAKVALNADFTCPNRDGTKGYGGCIFCSSSGSGDYAGNVHDHLEKQFQTISQVMKRKWPECAYIAYFQANTNTYGPLDKIKKMIAPFLNKEDVKGIALATRPDCLNEEIVQYLSTINKQKDVYIELGLQTIHEQTSKLINRGHTFQECLDGLALCRKYNLEVCVHIINGLPFETKEMMIETAKTLGQLDIQALKIHMLFVVKNTKLQQMHENHEFNMLSRQEYIDIVVEQLRYIKPEIVIERLTGDGKIDDLIAPLWSIKKVTILNDIDKKMKELDIYQGDLYKK